MPADRLPPQTSSPLLSRGPLTGWARRAYLPLLVAGFAAVFILYLIDSGVAAGRGEGALVPALVRGSEALLPAPALGRIGGSLSGISAAPVGNLILSGWLGLFLLVFTLSVEPFFRAATGMDSKWTRMVPFAALAGLPPFFLRSIPSDLPLLALSTLCLLFMMKRRWVLYGAALAASALNSETAVLFPLLFAFHFGRENRMERRPFLLLLLGQVAGVSLILYGWTDAAGRGAGLAEILHWEALARLLQAYRMEAAVAWIAVGLAVAFGWRDKPPFLKAALAMLLPLAAGWALVGFPRMAGAVYALYPAALSLVLFPFLKGLECRDGAASSRESNGVPEPS